MIIVLLYLLLYYEYHIVFAPKLKSIEIIRVHQSFIVNFSYVLAVSGKIITLLNGQQIPISYRKREEVKKQYMEYRRTCFD